MTLGQLLEKPEFTAVTRLDMAKEVKGGMCCDLLSWVMARGNCGMAWVTVQTHMNVIAVAALHEFSCILLAESCMMPPEVLNKAEQEGIAVIASALSQYAICGVLYGMGVG